MSAAVEFAQSGGLPIDTDQPSLNHAVVDGDPATATLRFLTRCVQTLASPSLTLKSTDMGALEWNSVLHAAEFHGLVPHIYAAAAANGDAQRIPQQVWEDLRRRASQSALRNAGLMREMARVLHEFAQARIPAIPHKGPMLAEQLWGNSGLRDSIDLDVLIPAEHVARAAEILNGLGYAPHEQLPQGRLPEHVRTASELAFQHAKAGITLELQWQLVPRCFSVDFDLEFCWRRTRAVSVCGVPALSLAPEDLFLSLCIHGWKHAWTRLIWLGDLLCLLHRHPDSDWAGVAERARNAGLARIISVPMLLLEALFGARVPDQLLSSSMRDNTSRRLAREAIARISALQVPEYLAWHSFLIRGRERWGDRMRYLTRFSFTPGIPDWNTVHLPSWAAAAYVPIRVVRLLGTGIGLGLARVQPNRAAKDYTSS